MEMDEWEETRLGIYADLLSGFAFKSEDFRNDGIPVIKIKNVASGKLRMNDVQCYPFELTERLKRFLLKKDDILIAMTGSHVTQPSSMVGKVCRFDLEIPALLNQRVGKVFSKDLRRLNEDFIFYFLKQNEITFELAASAGGSANQANISPDQIKELPIRLPTLPEQEAIANVLISLDKKIDLLRRQNRTLEALAETLFRQWFVEEADESWQLGKLGVLFDVGIGRTPPRKEQHWFSTNPNDYKWVSIKDMGNCGIYIDSVAEHLTAEAVERFNVPIIPTNTVLLSFKMTLGRLAITTDRMLSNEAIAHFKQKEDSVLFPEFLYLFLRTFRFENLGSTSSIVEAINSQMIKELVIPVPDENILKDFRELIEPFFSKIKRNSIQVRTLTQLRDALLPKLMSGAEVRVRF